MPRTCICSAFGTEPGAHHHSICPLFPADVAAPAPEGSRWSLRDDFRACEEGWAIFNSDTAPVIQADDEMEYFTSDLMLLAHLAARARAGDALARRAFALIRRENPAEADRIVAELRDGCGLEVPVALLA